jgi:hypothetical protein
MTTYYPTIKGMKQTQEKGFDPSSDSGAYMYNELMSKPWTQEDYFREHLGSGPEQGWGRKQNLAETIWRNSVSGAFITTNPQESFYAIRDRSTYEEQVEIMNDPPNIRERAAQKYPHLFD